MVLVRAYPQLGKFVEADQLDAKTYHAGRTPPHGRRGRVMRVVCIWIGLLALLYGAIEYKLYWVWFILLPIVLAAFSRAHRSAINKERDDE